MKLLPRELFKTVPVMPEHLIPLVQRSVLAPVILDYLFLTGNLHLCTDPMDNGSPRPDNPYKEEKRESDDHEPRKTTVFAMKYFLNSAQNSEFLYYSRQK